MNRLRLNLRLRIAIVVAVVSMTAVAAFGFAVLSAFHEMDETLIGQLAAEELEALVDRTREAPLPIVSRGPNFEYYVIRAGAEEESLPPTIRELGPGHHTIGSGVEEIHVAIRDVGDRRYAVLYDAGPHEQRAARFHDLLILALATAAIAAVVAGFTLATLLTRQLDELAGRIAELPIDQPHEQLERSDHDPEIATVARALDEYHARMVEMMQREQEFTANASHELRTPLTAIRTSCELIEADEGLAERTRERVARIEQAAKQMTARLESLLRVARQSPDTAYERFGLYDCLAETVAPWREEIDRKSLELEIDVDPALTLHLDRPALQLVVSNLLRNAVRHTDRGEIRISYHDNRLVVADTGPGIAAEHRQQVFKRHFRVDRRSEGFGLGLSIVTRVCEAHGWRVELESLAGQGSRFTVVLA